jgi:prepilin-type N-terminal cleavage/methylation domain-containing protein
MNRIKNIKENVKRENEDGFTLIEVLLALSIFSIGILGLASMQYATINGNVFARDVTEAIMLATDEIEKAKGADYDTLASFKKQYGNFTVAMRVVPVDSNHDGVVNTDDSFKNVIVAVRDSDNNRAFSMQTIVGKRFE